MVGPSIGLDFYYRTIKLYASEFCKLHFGMEKKTITALRMMDMKAQTIKTMEIPQEEKRLEKQLCFAVYATAHASS